MSRQVFLATFDNDGDLLAAVRAARERRFRIADVYTPCPVHGLSAAMGLPESRLSVVCLIAGLTGAVLITAFQYWTTAVTWPINVGGKPWNSWPAFMPPTFETMVLFAAIGTVLAFFVRTRLIPGKAPFPFVPGATDDAFVIAVEASDGLPDRAAVGRAFAPFNVRSVEMARSDGDR